MSKQEMQDFIEALGNDKDLADIFAKAVAGVARSEGFGVDEDDVLETFTGRPSTRPLPDDEVPGVTSAMMGEEDDRGRSSVTCAMGEEDGPKIHPRRPPGDVTSAMMGEEGGLTKAPPGPPRKTTKMTGEEGGPPMRRSTKKVGEEGGGPRRR